MTTAKHALVGFATMKYGQVSFGIKLLQSPSPEAVAAAMADESMEGVCLLMVGVIHPNPCLIAYDKQGRVIHHMHPDTSRPPSELEAQEMALLLDKIRASWEADAALPDALLTAMYIGMDKIGTVNKSLPKLRPHTPYPDDDDSKLDADLAAKVNVAAELIGKSIN